jgi:molybdenum cofactor guanylyltransferase
MRRDDASALILAGGKATRLGGIAKHAIVIEGRTIFERQVEVLAPRVAEILVSAPEPVRGYRTVVDIAEGIGPLAGVAAGLAAAATPWLVVVAGDMPYITGTVIDALLARTGDCDAVGIRVAGLPEPLLCALACAAAAPVVARRIAAGQRKASRLLTDGDLRVCWIEDSELRAIDPELRAFFNVNEPSDLRSQ